MRLCWTAGLREVCFVHLGKFGDIMIMLPAFKVVAEEMEKPVICMVSRDYASIFDGVSYVRPWVVNLHWWKGVGEARKIAVQEGFEPIVVKWWDEPGVPPPRKLENSRTITLTIHGQRRIVPAQEWDSFQASQWRYAGFTMEQMMEWPLVFDRRSPAREEELRRACFHSSKPKLLVNLSTTGSSPFKQGLQARGMLPAAACEIVSLENVRAHRIYDLLGLYDHAAGLVTSDTATLHLAAASSVPYIAFINNGGAGSIPKGNCILTIRYAELMSKIGFYVQAIKKLANIAAYA